MTLCKVKDVQQKKCFVVIAGGQKKTLNFDVMSVDVDVKFGKCQTDINVPSNVCYYKSQHAPYHMTAALL